MRNHDEYLEYQRRYREAHREELRAKDRERSRNNKEWRREYYEKNKERIMETRKKYYKEHYVSQKKDCSNNLPYNEDLFEVWKEINEDYLVSNYGKVWSKKRNRLIGCKNGMGYMIVKIDEKQQYIHRLVAEAFVPNPDNLPEIDHLDTDKTNNVWTNLRWTDRKGNQNNPITIEKFKAVGRSNFGETCNDKPVVQYSLDGGLLLEYCSIEEAAKKTGICRTNIGNCCNHRQHTAGGFRWEFVKKAESSYKSAS